MVDPRAPVDIGTFPTELSAQAFAAMVRDEGIQAAVFGRGGTFTGLVQDCLDWRLMVPAEEAERARQIILEAREAHDASIVVAHCPKCGYSMAGLDTAARCPECGLGLEDSRDQLRTKGLIIHDTPARPTNRHSRGLWVGLLVCASAGLLAVALGQAYWSWNSNPWIDDPNLPAKGRSELAHSVAWWTPIPLGLVVFLVGAAALIWRRKHATDHPHGGPDEASQETLR